MSVASARLLPRGAPAGPAGPALPRRPARQACSTLRSSRCAAVSGGDASSPAPSGDAGARSGVPPAQNFQAWEAMDPRAQMPGPPPGYEHGQAIPPPPMYYYGYYPQQQAPPAAKSSPGVPGVVWVGVGAVLGVVGLKVFDFVKDGPAGMQQKLMAAAMEKAMGAQGAGSPFGAGFPAPGMGMGARPGPVVDTTATTASASSSRDARPAPAVSQWEKKAKNRAPSGSSAGRTGSEAAKAVGSQGAKEADASGAAKKKRSAFRDLSSDAATDATVVEATSTPSDSSSTDTRAMVAEMMDRVLTDPEAQKMLYPHLPEHMRSPETFKWMLENPEMKAQIQQMLEQQMGQADPAVAEAVGGFDLSSPEVQAQFEALGMKPEELMQKMWSDPELMQGLMNPKVQAAIADIQRNPANMLKHMSDPEVSRIMLKMQQMFAPQAMQKQAAKNGAK